AGEMRRRVNRTTDPRKRLQAVGAAYIDFALTQPGLFRTAFTSHPTASDRPTEPETGSDEPAEPYEILGQVLDDAQAAGLLDARRSAGAEIAAWPAVHGLANLLPDGLLPTTAAAIKFATGKVFDVIDSGLLDSA